MNTWFIIHFIVAIVSLIWCFLNLQVSFVRRLYSYYIFTYGSHLMILDSAWKTSRFKYKISIYRLCLVFYLNVNFILSIFFSCRLKRKLSHYHLHTTNSIYWTWAKYIEKVCNGVIFDRYIHNSSLRMHCAMCMNLQTYSKSGAFHFIMVFIK